MSASAALEPRGRLPLASARILPAEPVLSRFVRITVVGPTHPFKGGIAQHTAVLARELSLRGHDVVVQNWRRQYPALFYPGQLTIDDPEFPIHRPTRRNLSWNRPDSWWSVGRSARHSDLLLIAHVNPVQVVPYRVLLAAAKGAGKSIVLAHNVLPHERSWLDAFLVGRLFGAADRIVTHSRAQQRLADELSGTEAVMAPIAPFLPPGFVPAHPLPGEHRRLLFFGLVRRYKGLDVALRALAAGPADIELRVAGEFWGGTAPIQALIDELGLRDRVELLPGYATAERVPGLFSDVDALVLPYRTASGSQGVWTAFQFGVPVLVTAAGRLADDVTDGVDGLVAAPDDVHSLATAIGEFYRPGVPERMRAAVRPVDPAPYWDRYIAELLRPGTDRVVR